MKYYKSCNSLKVQKGKKRTPKSSFLLLGAPVHIAIRIQLVEDIFIFIRI